MNTEFEVATTTITGAAQDLEQDLERGVGLACNESPLLVVIAVCATADTNSHDLARTVAREFERVLRNLSFHAPTIAHSGGGNHANSGQGVARNA